VQLTALLWYLVKHPVYEGLWHRVFRAKGEDQPSAWFEGRGAEVSPPGMIAGRHKRLGPEGVVLEHLINHDVVVIQLETGEGGQFPSDRVLAAGRRAVEEDEVHGRS